MAVMSIGAMHREILLEQHAEATAFKYLHGDNFTDSLRILDIPTEIVVTTGGETITYHAKDIFDSRPWTRFVQQEASSIDLCKLTSTVEPLSAKYVQWLVDGRYTKRYVSLKNTEHIKWLEKIVPFAISQRILENKYYASTYTEVNNFANPDVANNIANIMFMRWFSKTILKTIGRSYKYNGDTEERQKLFHDFCDEFYKHAKDERMNRVFEIPLLPQGVEAPLKFLD